jgi:hypothetical protein
MVELADFLQLVDKFRPLLPDSWQIILMIPPSCCTKKISCYIVHVAFTIHLQLTQVLRFYLNYKDQNIHLWEIEDADSKDHNCFTGAPLVFPEIGGVNFKTSIFSNYFG